MNSFKSKNLFHNFPICILFASLLFITIGYSQPNLKQNTNGNYALQFDGLDDEVLFGNATLDLRGDITLCAWFKTERSQWGSLISNFDQHRPDHGYELCVGSLYEDGGFIYLECTYNDYRDGYSSDASFNDGKWHYVSAVYTPDGSSRGRVFVDGIEQPGEYWGEPVSAIGATPGYPLKFGACSNRAGPEEAGNFYGIIDEVRIWNKALTLEEIQTTMYNHLSGTEDGLVGYWPLNEGSGNLVNDFTANQHQGTISGAIWTASGAPIGTVIIFCNPNFGYQNHNLFTSIRGANTHFIDGTKRIWLSKDGNTIPADRHDVLSNIEMDVRFYIPCEAALGKWNINVETILDSIITMPLGIEILPPPSVQVQNSGTTSWLRSIFAIDTQSAWAVGNDGCIRKTTDGGLTWEMQDTGASDVFNSAYFTGASTGYVVGQYGTIYKTTDGGVEWNPQISGTTNNLQSVYFACASTGWTVGRLGTILKTTDGGLNWHSQISGTTSWLYSVCFINENIGWAAGSNGTILNTIDGGITWKSQNSGTLKYLSSVYCIDTDTCWTVGGDGTILKTTDGGMNWLSIDSGISEWLKSVYFIDGQTGWAVGTNGIFLMTTDGGVTWTQRKSFTNKKLNSICFADGTTGWATGEKGTILKLSMSNLATAIEADFEAASIPEQFQLFQNYPNPFNTTTNIQYHLPAPEHVSLKIYSTLGEFVKEVVNERQSAGTKNVKWDGNNQFGESMSSGVYIYHIRTAQFEQSQKMILLK